MEGSCPICGAAPPNIPSVDFSGLFTLSGRHGPFFEKLDSTAAIRGEKCVCAEDGNGEKRRARVSDGRRYPLRTRSSRLVL